MTVPALEAIIFAVFLLCFPMTVRSVMVVRVGGCTIQRFSWHKKEHRTKYSWMAKERRQVFLDAKILMPQIFQNRNQTDVHVTVDWSNYKRNNKNNTNNTRIEHDKASQPRWGSQTVASSSSPPLGDSSSSCFSNCVEMQRNES